MTDKDPDMVTILTKRWEGQLLEGQRMIEEAEQHLGWVANVYSGQLSLTLLEDDIRE